MTHIPYSDIDQAMYDLVHDYPGGAVALAPLVRMNAGTLSNKVNPMMDSHHLTVAEAVQIQLIRQAFPLFHAEARAFNQIAIPMPSVQPCSDMDILDAWAHWHQDTAETAMMIKQILDGVEISKRDLAELKREIFEDAQRELELLQILEAMCDD
jgi:hypothetical protein